MRFSQLIDESRVEPELPGMDKGEILYHLAHRLATALDLIDATLPQTDPETIFHLLLEREHLGTTGIGGGIAVPHGRLHGLEHAIAVLGRSPQGVAFGALDDHPVHVLVGLLTPEGDNGIHLEALSAISRLFARHAICEGLLLAPDRHAMHQVVLDSERHE